MSSQQILLGSGSGADPVYVDNLFSIDLWAGNNTADRAITTGLDLSGEGGMVWIKSRSSGSSSSYEHLVFDTERGWGKKISPNDYAVASNANSGTLKSFTSTGYTLGYDTEVNHTNGGDYVGWSFRKQEKFFNVVTWTGNETAGRQISHGLGSVPGCIMVKCTSHAHNWQVWHRDLTGGTSSAKMLILNNTDAEANGNWNSDIDVDATTFTVGSGNDTNSNNKTYVGYIFGHNEQEFGPDSDESIIYCGTYTGNGNATGPIVNIGWEPQWLLIKRMETSGGQWVIADTMRGIASGPNDDVLYADNYGAETNYEYLEVNGTGFQLKSTSGDVNDSSKKYIYIAIRRPDGAGKPPDAGTDVFAMDTGSSSSTIPNFDSGFPVDMAFMRRPETTDDWWLSTRLLQGKENKINGNDAAGNYNKAVFDSNLGWQNESNHGSTYQSWMFKRHAGFDVVSYLGTGSNQTIAHSLGQAPQMIWLKNGSNSANSNATAVWLVWHEDLTSGSYSNSPNTNNFLELNTTEGVGTGAYFNSTAPTSSVVSLGANGNKWDVRQNQSGDRYLMLLFASVTGICKVGSYAGSNSTQTITTGFQPRFVIIRNITEGGSDWAVFDTVRGWGSGVDERLRLNSNAAENDDDDVGAPTSTGFTVNNIGFVNESGANYIYYAHA